MVQISLDPDEWAPPARKAAVVLLPAMTYAEHGLVRRFRQVLGERSEVVATSLRSGLPDTLDAYRQAVGELKGLDFALSSLLAVEREMSGSDVAKTKDDPLYVA